MAVDLVRIQTAEHLNRIFEVSDHGYGVSNFRRAASVENRTGHARFRRGPSDPQPSSSSSSRSEQLKKATDQMVTSSDSTEASKPSTSTSFTSSVTGDASVSNGKQFSSGFVVPAPVFSSKKPPLPSSHRKRAGDYAFLDRPARNHCPSRSCHCFKRRKLQSKRAIVKVPPIGSKIASIPSDEYTWKKCGEKQSEGSTYPRVYYKCSCARGCPARKRVEIADDGSKMLIVTYAGEHQHSHAPSPVLPRLTTLPIGSIIQSKREK